MPIIDHFDLIAPYYDRLIGFHRAEQLEALMGLPVTGTLLDAGGGTGRIAQSLVEKVGKIIVADYSMKMLRQAAKKDGLQALNTAVEALPFPDGTFERILMVDAFHHVGDQVETARELWRVLKPGGRLVIEEPNIDTFPVKLVACFEKIALMRSHFLPPERIAGLFDHPGGRKAIEREGYQAWVVVEKGGEGTNMQRGSP